MAQRSSQISGYLALVALVSVTAWAFYGLSSLAEGRLAGSVFTDPYIHRILGFSLKQAALSASAAVLLAVPVARALYYLPNLLGKRAFLALCLLCFVLPTLILITGLVALLGSAGSLSPYLGKSWNLYGLQGILLAHLFLNLPFAIRSFYLQLQALPASSWILARQLKLSSWQQWAVLEWPQLRARLLTVWVFIFVLCFNSFAVVLSLGGGPQSTTLEVAIYQALKYDFNIPEALSLAWLQLLITGSFYLAMTRFGSSAWLSADTARPEFLPRLRSWQMLYQQLIYYLTWTFFLLPLLALIPSWWQINFEGLTKINLIKPLITTLSLGLIAASLAVLIAVLVLSPIRWARRQQQQQKQWLLEGLANHSLVLPAMVLSVGLYVWSLRHLDLEVWGIFFVILVNTLILVPFAVQQLKPRLFQFDDQYQYLAQQLKLNAWAYWQVVLPWLQRDLQAAFVLCLLLAMGDVAVFSIFATDTWISLPWLIYSYAGSYRIAEASVLACLFLLICAALVVWLEKIKNK
ncbi:MAG: ABC transporter permease subunit [Thiothrix sp.]|nr:MAG: ABC transporter permease subunit [Thiothrix sp.]